MPEGVGVGVESHSAMHQDARRGTRALAWHRERTAREPELIDDEDAAETGYGLRLFLANGPIGTWQDGSP